MLFQARLTSKILNIEKREKFIEVRSKQSLKPRQISAEKRKKERRKIIPPQFVKLGLTSPKILLPKNIATTFHTLHQ